MVFRISPEVWQFHMLWMSYESQYHTVKWHNLVVSCSVIQFVVCTGLITLTASAHLARLNLHLNVHLCAIICYPMAIFSIATVLEVYSAIIYFFIVAELIKILQRGWNVHAPFLSRVSHWSSVTMKAASENRLSSAFSIDLRLLSHETPIEWTPRIEVGQLQITHRRISNYW